MKRIIPIFFATDDNYAPFLEVALQSMTTQASKEFTYHIYILNQHLSDESKKILSRFHNDTFHINFTDPTNELADLEKSLHTRDYYSKTTYYRIFIPDMFPQYAKVLYLDCDIVVNGDISELFLTEIGSNLLGVCSEEALDTTVEFRDYARNVLGLSPSAYFNAGILIMNLDALRAFNLRDRFVNLLNQCKFVVAQDQDYLNVLCKDKVFYFSLNWNKMPVYNCDYQIKDIRLIHYKLSLKPWHYDGILYEDIFWKHAKRCGFYDKILSIKKNYSAEDKERDSKVDENLKRTAREEASSENTYWSLFLNGKIKSL